MWICKLVWNYEKAFLFSVSCFQHLLVICHKTKQKYTKYMHLDCPKSSKRCFQLFFNPCLMYQQEAAWCITHIFNFVAWCIKSQTILSEKVTQKVVSFQFSVFFLTYLLNNISARDINSFTSSYIYSFMPVLDWSIIPYRKIVLRFHKQAPSTKTTYFLSNQFAHVKRQIYHNSLYIPVIFHTCLESHEK